MYTEYHFALTTSLANNLSFHTDNCLNCTGFNITRTAGFMVATPTKLRFVRAMLRVVERGIERVSPTSRYSQYSHINHHHTHTRHTPHTNKQTPPPTLAYLARSRSVLLEGGTRPWLKFFTTDIDMAGHNCLQYVKGPLLPSQSNRNCSSNRTNCATAPAYSLKLCAALFLFRRPLLLRRLLLLRPLLLLLLSSILANKKRNAATKALPCASTVNMLERLAGAGGGTYSSFTPLSLCCCLSFCRRSVVGVGVKVVVRWWSGSGSGNKKKKKKKVVSVLCYNSTAFNCSSSHHHHHHPVFVLPLAPAPGLRTTLS